MKKNSSVIFSIGVIAGIAFVATCDTSSGGGRFGDGGAMLGDGVGIGIDIGIPDAQASTAMAFDCDKTETFSQSYPAGSYSSTTDTFFADVAIAGLDPAKAPHISVILCQPTFYGVTNSCPSGYTCSSSGMPFPTNLQCAPGSFTLDAGRMVINCGSHLRQTSAGNTYNYGTRYAKAYVRID